MRGGGGMSESLSLPAFSWEAGNMRENPVDRLIAELKKRRVFRKRTSRKRINGDAAAFINIIGVKASAYGTQGGFY